MNPLRFLSFSLLSKRPSRFARSIVVTSGFLAGCAGSGGEGNTASGGKCFAPESVAPPPEVALSEAKFKKSKVWLTAELPETAYTESLNREIPFTLAEEKKRDVGAPGYATYRVTRGTPTLHPTETGLAVQVPINADISVCKKIGSACIQYGSCKPSFLATFSIDTSMNKNFQVAPPKGAIHATEKCVIGLDVTGQIEKIAQAEVAKVEAQIKKQWPKFKREVIRAYREAEPAVPLTENSCLLLQPEQLYYQAPELQQRKNGRELVAGVGVEGTIVPAADCKERQDLGSPARPKTNKKAPKKSKIFIPEVLALDSVRDALKKNLTGPWGDRQSLTVEDLRFEPDSVHLKVEASGSVCGSFWLSAQLSHKAGEDHLGLSDVKLVEKSEVPLELKDFVAHIEEQAKVELVSELWFSDESNKLLEAAVRATVPQSVKFDVRGLKAHDAEVSVTSGGVVLSHPVTAKLVVTGL